MKFFTSCAARVVVGVSILAMSACGGGGGGGGGTTPGGGGGGSLTPSVSGDMIAYQANRGWNYQGTALGGQAVTFTVYADPQQSGIIPLILFGGRGTASTAFAGTKLGGIGVQSTAGGYVVGSYVLLNNDGSTYASGGLSGLPMLVPSTLTQGQSFSSYPGLAAVVQTVGTVPGASACPAPATNATGATVAYAYAGQNYAVSYVPGCGITQYLGNHGEVITLVSVGSYPQVGVQSTRRMDTLTVFDTLKSAARILTSGARWDAGLKQL